MFFTAFVADVESGAMLMNILKVKIGSSPMHKLTLPTQQAKTDHKRKTLADT